MLIGIPKEVKDHEYRVGMIPASVHALVSAGHQVIVQDGAGLGSGIPNEDYVAAGGEIVPDAATVYGRAEMVVKVKEPVESEYGLLKRGQTLFTYLHLAPLPELTSVLLEREITGVAYETIEDRQGRLPLLTPMSEVAGRMAVVTGASFLQKGHGGRGTLIAGVPGVPPGDVVVLGGGIVGLNSIKMAQGLGASVTVLDTNLDRLREIDDLFHGAVRTLASNQYNLRASLRRADLFIGAVLIPGRSAPKLVSREMLTLMKEGAVAVDVAVDQGGCMETTHATTHSNPTYVVEGVVHYCVANMPGAVPRTSTFALNNATLPYALSLANKGVPRAAQEDPGLLLGVNTYKGHITYQAVADSLGQPYKDFRELV
ncbi:MAG TPA: alanine dehydrogenase [Thermoanaerobaculia bacterium]|nr:alanine dehydrogenase [Thermoanaerobaculia bacterium]